jgi:hypothetical protein
MRVGASLAFNIINDVKTELRDDAAWKNFITKRCVGVLTKVDKELEDNSEKGASEYNKGAAAKLRGSLFCVGRAPHLDELVPRSWVAVLNPNPNEQKQVRPPSALPANRVS